MKVRDYRVRGVAALAEVADVLQHLATEWAAAWGVGTAVKSAALPATTADILNLCDSMDSRCLELGAGVVGSVWINHWSEVCQSVESQLFALDQGRYSMAKLPKEGIGAQVVNDALDDLLQRLAQAFKLEVAAAARYPLLDTLRPWTEPGSGAVSILLRVGALTLQLIASVNAVDALAPVAQSQSAATPLRKIRLADAIGGHTHQVDLVMGHADVDMSSLVKMRIGDILRLDRPIDQSLDLVGPDGVPILRAYLGHLEGCKAVKILPYSPASRTL